MRVPQYATPVEELPEPNISLSVPKIQEGYVKIRFEEVTSNRVLDALIEDGIAAIIIHLCAEKGKWTAVSADDFRALLQKVLPLRLLTVQIFQKIWEMHERMLLEVVTFEKKEYFVPSLALVTLLAMYGKQSSLLKIQ